METILNITELHDFSFEKNKTWHNTYEGYEIETNKQKIYVLISNISDCCEQWGHASTPDNLSDFIGAKLLSIVRVNDKLETAITIETEEEAQTMFVNFNTDRGLFQLTVYNSHNGYYGHSAIVRSKQLNIDESL